MPEYSLWDINGCNCGCDCSPCQLPATELFFTATGTAVFDPPFSGTMEYLGGCTWNSCIPAVGTNSFNFTITCIAGVTGYVLEYQNTEDCAGTVSATYDLVVFSYSCSPVDIVLRNSGGITFISIALTT
jgi:hypothetical protein